MPMSFPDLKSLERAASVHGFREKIDSETEDDYRVLLADHVADIDFIESQEIRTGSGWDEWTEEQNKEMLRRSGVYIP